MHFFAARNNAPGQAASCQSFHVMRKMAFGDQQVDFGHGDNVDNSQIRRCRQIERWAMECMRRAQKMMQKPRQHISRGRGR